MENISEKYIRVKVFANSKKEGLRQVGSDKFECHVREKAERNLANARALELVSDYLGLEKKNLRIRSGHQRPNKIISISE